MRIRKWMTTARSLPAASGVAIALAAGGAMAHGGEEEKQSAKNSVDYANAEVHPFGRASDPAEAARTIDVEMSDAMRFEPSTIEVAAGKPLRFVAQNEGNLLHEMVIGTRDALDEHAALMKRFPGMEHEEPYMAHVPPGENREIGWTFTEPGEYWYGCLVPGHYDAGMVGRVIVR